MGNQNQGVARALLHFFLCKPCAILGHFELAADGSSQMVETIGSDKPIIYKLASPVTLTSEQKADYVGKYYSPELDATYRVLLQEDSLVLDRPRYGMGQLRSVFEDGFIMLEAEHLGTINLLFNRDAQHQITGFNLSIHQVRHLSFEKQINS